MDVVLAAKVWHYWIAWALLLPAILLFVALAVGYLIKVVRPRYRGQ